MKNPIFLCCIALLIALSFASILYFSTDEPTPTIKSFEYTVKSSDTLWSLSGEYANGQDRMEWILEVMSRNHMDDETIYVGETIEVYTWEWEVE